VPYGRVRRPDWCRAARLLSHPSADVRANGAEATMRAANAIAIYSLIVGVILIGRA